MNKVIAVDFDGTLCVSAYPDIGPPREDILRKLKKEQCDDAKIILWTCREGTLLQDALAWCTWRSVHFDAVNANLPERIALFGTDPRKIGADEYWEDRAWNPNGYDFVNTASK